MPPRRSRRASSPPVIYDDYSSDSIHEFIDDEDDSNSNTSAEISDDDDDSIALLDFIVRDNDEDMEYTLTSENVANNVEGNLDDSGHLSGSSDSPVYLPPRNARVINEPGPSTSVMPPRGTRTSSTRRRGRSASTAATNEIANQVANEVINECNYEVPAKIPKLETNIEESPAAIDENGCPICFDDYTQTGEHRLVCLKCGHIFGKSCIERWIKVEKNNKCPTCKMTAKAADIRNVFGNFISGNSNETIQLRGQVKNLQTENITLISVKEQLEKELLNAKQQIEELHVLYAVPTEDKTFELIIKKIGNVFAVSTIKTKIARSFGFSMNGNFIITGCEMSALGGKPYGLQKISLNGGGIPEKLPAHKQSLRCIRVCPFNSNLVASLSDIDKELNIYESKQDKPLELRHSYKLDHLTWTFCWESETKLVVGTRNGILQRITLGTKNFEELVEKTNEPILDVFYNHCHEVFFVGTVKGVYAYRHGVKDLIKGDPNDNKSRVQSFYYDAKSECFLLTVPPGDGLPIRLQLYRVDMIGKNIKSTMIREYVSTVKTTSSTTANIFWTAPTGHIVCSFYDEPKNFTRIFNWGKRDDQNSLEIIPRNERTLRPAGDTDGVSQYAYFNRKTQPSSIAPNGIQDVFAILTRSKLHTYCLQYGK